MRIKGTKLSKEVSHIQNSNLAKLLATENITVEHQNIPTAYFNVQERILGLPIWKDVTEDVYDLLVGHEVGHALFTPTDDVEELCSEIDDNPNSFHAVKSYINILEDIRIEKKIKRKFGGLRKSFYRGYTELVEKNFFGTDGRLLESYSFIDRINLRFKTGMDIPFNDREMEVVRKLENIESFDEVMEISKELYEGSDDASRLEEIETSVSAEGDEEFGDGEYDSMENGSGFPDLDKEIDSSNGHEDSDDDADEEVGIGNDSDDSDGESDEELSGTGNSSQGSETQDSFDQNSFNELVDPVAIEPFYCNIPDVDSDPFIVSTKKFYRSVKKSLDTPRFTSTSRTDNRGNEQSFMDIFKMDYIKFKNDSKKTVNYLVKEFEMKKNAEQYARASTSKSGVIDVNKLHSYRFNDDIFKKITVVPDGKNHGLVIFVDWSSSMYDNIYNTIKQLLNLVWFAKKINIPFDVYAFTDSYVYERNYGNFYKNKDVVLNKVNLLHFFSSGQKSNDFNESCFDLFCLGSAFRYQEAWGLGSKVSLSSTPLNEAIILAHDIIEKFKKNHRLSVVNSIFLTDGEANSLNYVVDDDSTTPKSHNGIAVGTCKLKSFNHGIHWTSASSYISDPKTKITYKFTNRVGMTNVLLKSLQDRLGINVIGFFIANRGYEAVNAIRTHYDGEYGADKALIRKYNKEKSLIINHAGYTEFYIIKGGNELDTDSDELDVNSDSTKRVITSAFKKHSKSKTLNRVVLSRFIELIA